MGKASRTKKAFRESTAPEERNALRLQRKELRKNNSGGEIQRIENGKHVSYQITPKIIISVLRSSRHKVIPKFSQTRRVRLGGNPIHSKAK